MQKKIFWPQEVKEGRVLWPLQIKFDISFCLPNDRWENDKILLPPLSQGITFQRALQEIKDNIVSDILHNFPKTRG